MHTRMRLGELLLASGLSGAVAEAAVSACSGARSASAVISAVTARSCAGTVTACSVASCGSAVPALVHYSLISFLYYFKHVLRSLITRVLVRVVLAAQISVRFFYFIVRCVRRYAEYLIGVCHFLF